MGCVATHRLCFCMCGSHIVCMCGSHSLRVNGPHNVSKCVNIRKGFQCVDTCFFYVWRPQFEGKCATKKYQNVSILGKVSMSFVIKTWKKFHLLMYCILKFLCKGIPIATRFIRYVSSFEYKPLLWKTTSPLSTEKGFLDFEIT